MTAKWRSASRLSRQARIQSVLGFERLQPCFLEYQCWGDERALQSSQQYKCQIIPALRVMDPLFDGISNGSDDFLKRLIHLDD